MPPTPSPTITPSSISSSLDSYDPTFLSYICGYQGQGLPMIKILKITFFLNFKGSHSHVEWKYSIAKIGEQRRSLLEYKKEWPNLGIGHRANVNQCKDLTTYGWCAAPSFCVCLSPKPSPFSSAISPSPGWRLTWRADVSQSENAWGKLTYPTTAEAP